MNWDAIGAVAEILGGFAVLVSLVYLMIQVRQIKSSMSLTAYMDANSLFSTLTTAVMTSPELAKVISKARKKEVLDDWELEILKNHFYNTVNAWEVTYRNAKAGALRVSEKEMEIMVAAAFEEFFWFEEMWSKHRDVYPEEWKQFVQSIFQSAKGT